MLDVHPETIRVWERRGLINPDRPRSHRRFSDSDVKRLFFIRHLIADKGFNLAALRAYIELYPCWSSEDCVPLLNVREWRSGAKPCWRDQTTYCLGNAGSCDHCPCRAGHDSVSLATLPVLEHQPLGKR